MNVSNTKTSDFLLPLADIPYAKLDNLYFSNAYIGHSSERELLGKNLYLVFEEPVDAVELMELNPDKFEYSLEDGKIGVYSITDEEQETIVKPFIDGKYSLIDRDYVSKNYAPSIIVNGREYHDYCFDVLNKAETIKKYWEHRINTTLPEGAEVWSKPDLTIECYEGDN